MNAHVIAVANNKGGVGKTAVVTNLGAGFAMQGYNTLLIDLDGQANLTDAFFAETDIKETIAQALSAGRPLPIQEKQRRLSIVPSGKDTTYLEEEELQRLNSALQPLLSEYDIIIIDTPPSIGEHTISALCSADSLLIPLLAEPSSLKGLYAIKQLANDIRQKANNHLIDLGIVLCFYDERKRLSRLCKSIIEDNYPTELCKSTIRRSIAVAEAFLERKDIFSYNRRSTGAEDYRALAKELLKRMGTPSRK